MYITTCWLLSSFHFNTSSKKKKTTREINIPFFPFPIQRKWNLLRLEWKEEACSWYILFFCLSLCAGCAMPSIRRRRFSMLLQRFHNTWACCPMHGYENLQLQTTSLSSLFRLWSKMHHVGCLPTRAPFLVTFFSSASIHSMMTMSSRENNIFVMVEERERELWEKRPETETTLLHWYTYYHRFNSLIWSLFLVLGLPSK